MRNERPILLAVEDDPSYASLLRHELGWADPPCEVVSAARPSEAVERLAEGGIDLILLDLMLPGSEGLDSLRTMLAAAPGIPIVVVTALDDPELLVEAVRMGAQDALVKRETDGPRTARAVRFALARHAAAERRLDARVAREIRPRTEGERQRLLVRLAAAQEEERRRIAGSLHDDPIRQLSSIARGLEDLETRTEDPVQRVFVGDLRERAVGAGERLRRMLFDLRPTTLDREGLAAAISHALERESEVFEVRLDDRLGTEPPPRARLALFRIAQEALVNASRHSHAESIKVILEERDGGYAVSVIDDGVGFEPEGAERPGHLGLVRMHEQAELIGGWCRIESAPAAGTTVEAWVRA